VIGELADDAPDHALQVKARLLSQADRDGR
jgi:hypothetical protein